MIRRIDIIDPVHIYMHLPCEWCHAEWHPLPGYGHAMDHADGCAYIAELDAEALRLDALDALAGV